MNAAATACAARPGVQLAAGRRGAVRVAAAWGVGAAVKVKPAIKIWHVPKLKGLELQGRTGKVVLLDDNHKGVAISATLPVVVQFEVTPEARSARVVARAARELLSAGPKEERQRELRT